MWVRVAVDSGGTFTDVVALCEDGSVRVAKVPSTPHDPGRATAEGTRLVIGDDRGVELRHGTTVPTNALLEGAGARTALVTTAGFRDVIEIGRQRRPDLYDPLTSRPPALVPPGLRFEVVERLEPDGSVRTALDPTGLVEAIAEAAPEAVAVSLLHSYADDAHEQAVASLLDDAGDWLVVRSSEVAPEFREFERTSTTVLHAYLGPRTSTYLGALAAAPGLPDRILVMRSAGGLTALGDLARRPADALLSGPAAGALAAAAVAWGAGYPNAVSFDMGGTSTDVCLVLDGRAELRTLTSVAGYPCLAPALAIHTVGAGGGSIAGYDPGGALGVGPRSAGAEPGPACYGRGGTDPTVTDANVVLGRLRSLVGGEMSLDTDAAARSVDLLGEGAAEAVVQVVEANMERALREVTVQKGVSPDGLALVAFGGAGGLHAAALARALGAAAVLVPPKAGVFSAVGLLAAPVRADRSRTRLEALDTFDPGSLDGLAAEARGDVAWAADGVVGRDLRVERWIDCRYRGQSHELRVPVEAGDTAAILAARFHAEHERRNGFRRDGAPVQVVTLRAQAEVPSPVGVADVLGAVAPATSGSAVVETAEAGMRHVERRSLPVGFSDSGPLLVTDVESTTWVPEGFQVRVDELANLVLEEA